MPVERLSAESELTHLTRVLLVAALVQREGSPGLETAAKEVSHYDCLYGLTESNQRKKKHNTPDAAGQSRTRRQTVWLTYT